ncbi:hypothetical protein DERF_014013 [Dermatophagoides farinae]|uniref:Uncharacterized protein n=1 Tax=Dermatophagoides farinae TaxID=6954 RepID=A0A922KWC5_DERFA|nr:hypothetical protein DERF_014013 [Dermatophagoides farinae]
MVIGGQIPGRTIEQNLTSEARDGFAMSWRSAFEQNLTSVARDGFAMVPETGNGRSLFSIKYNYYPGTGLLS